MKNIFYKVTARTMLLNRTRTIVTILGVGLSAAMLTAVAVFGVSIIKYLETRTVQNEGSWHVAAEGFQESEIAQLGQDERVKSISLQEEVGYIKGSENDGNYIRIVNRDGNAWKNLPLQLEKGRMPENDREILIPYDGMELDGQEESTVEDGREYEHLFYIEFSQEASELPKQYGSGNVSSPVLIFSEEQAQQYMQYAELPAKEGGRGGYEPAGCPCYPGAVLWIYYSVISDCSSQCV